MDPLGGWAVEDADQATQSSLEGSDTPFNVVTGSATVSVSDLVTDRIRLAITGGRLPIGERLCQSELAGKFQVSRQPIRTALQQLSSEGLVERMPGGGYRIREISRKEIQDNYLLRQLLESEAAAIAAERSQPGLADNLIRVNAEFVAAHQRETRPMLTANSTFHRMIRAASNVPMLMKIIDELWNGITVLTPSFIPERADRSAAEHDEIIAALSAHDATGARATMKRHIENARKDFQAQILVR